MLALALCDHSYTVCRAGALGCLSDTVVNLYRSFALLHTLNHCRLYVLWPWPAVL